MSTTTRKAPGLSIRQMMVLVLYAAVGAFVLTPIATLVNLGMATWGGLAMWGLVAVPLAWTLMVLLTFRRGPGRDWLVAVLLVISTLGVIGWIGYFNWMFFGQGGLMPIPSYTSGMKLYIAGSWGLAFGLSFGLAVMLRIAIPGKCHACRRRRLLRAGWVRGSEGKLRRACCAACGVESDRVGRDRRPRASVEDAAAEPWAA